jgi:hypothetical protein
MGGTGCGACGPAKLAAKAACATTMKTGTTRMLTSFLIYLHREIAMLYE